MQPATMRQELIRLFEEKAIASGKGFGFPESQVRRMFQEGMGMFQDVIPSHLRGTTFIKSLMMRLRLPSSKFIIFGADQANVFLEHQFTHKDGLEFQLPFPALLLCFSEPVTMWVSGKEVEIMGLMMIQESRDKQAMIETCERHGGGQGVPGRTFTKQVEAAPEGSILTLNNAYAIALGSDGVPIAYPCVWMNHTFDEFIAETSDDDAARIRSLAIACVGYINCENIYLHKEDGAPDSVNRKRERQGKKILEPYYVCRIKGVQYDSNGEPTGEGTHHGFRYDVRGHFRKMATGKTTWVRSHQRGLHNELYVPKTYVVAKHPAQVEAVK